MKLVSSKHLKLKVWKFNEKKSEENEPIVHGVKFIILVNENCFHNHQPTTQNYEFKPHILMTILRKKNIIYYSRHIFV